MRTSSTERSVVTFGLDSKAGIAEEAYQTLLPRLGWTPRFVSIAAISRKDACDPCEEPREGRTAPAQTGRAIEQIFITRHSSRDRAETLIGYSLPIPSKDVSPSVCISEIASGPSGRITERSSPSKRPMHPRFRANVATTR